jgi:hypothetical protein
MTDTLVTFETAKLAKKIGFSIVTENKYFLNKKLTTKQQHQSSKPMIYAPNQSLLQRWLREVHNIHIEVFFDTVCYDYRLINMHDLHIKNLRNYKLGHKYINTYEEALEIGLQQGLNLVKL